MPDIEAGTIDVQQRRWQIFSWLRSRLAALEPSPRGAELAGGIVEALALPGNEALLAELSISSRERIVASLNAEQARLSREPKPRDS